MEPNDTSNLQVASDDMTRIILGADANTPNQQEPVQHDLLKDLDSCESASSPNLPIADAYWKQYMAMCESMPFPTLPPSITSPVSDSVVEHRLPSLNEIDDFTASTIMRAAWALVSGSMTNSDDVVFGAVVFGRNVPTASIDKLSAPTFAIVPVRVQLDRQQTCLDYLKSIQKDAADMIPFEQTGFQRIANLSDDCRRACRFQSLLVVHPRKNDQVHTTLGEWTNLNQELWSNACCLTIEAAVSPGRVAITARFDSRVIDASSVHQLLQRFELVIGQLGTGGPEIILNDIHLITSEDISQIWEWNHKFPDPIDRCVHDMAEEHARSQPNAPAVCSWDGDLTWGELDRLANSLATRLIQHDVGADVFVPICFEKSLWVPVAVLGILKAGGAFVFLDPSLPEKRLRTIVEQTNAKVVLCSESTQALGLRLVDNIMVVGPSLATTANDQKPKPIRPASPSSLLLAPFTSGSTGRPKGTMITHRNYASALHYQSKGYGFTTETRLYDFSSYAFDMPIFSMLTVIDTGGCLCIPSNEDRDNNLAGSINSLRANSAMFTPSTIQLLSPADVPQLRTILFGGERLRSRDIEPWWGKVRLINTYGPSECTPVSTVNNDAITLEEATSIGKATGQITWLTDPEDHNILVPPGCIGEILLEGPLVGQGYLNEPEKTAAAFIENPRWLLEGAPGYSGRQGRLYKTGDLARYSRDGKLIFIGRKDSQVKIHGQRVELGEIESKIQEAMKEARQVVVEVIKPQGERSTETLAAFLKMSHTESTEEVTCIPIPQDVEDRLVEYLPRYMQPTVFFTMKQLPQTINGKINRKQLCEIGASFSLSQIAELDKGVKNVAREPASELEHELQKLWGQVLNLNPSVISPDDSFIRIGGDSITAMQVATAARSLSIRIRSTDILRQKTIANLARMIGKSGNKTKPDPNGTSLKASGPRVYQLSPIQRLFFNSQPDPMVSFDQRFFLRLRHDMTCTVSMGLETLVQRHAILRSRFTKTKQGIWRTQISENVTESFHLHTENGTQVSQHEIIQQCRERLNIEKGPLVAAAFFNNSKTKSLFIAIHHLVVDLVSWRVLLRELEEVLTGQSIPMTPSMDFGSWVNAQAEYALEHLEPEVLPPDECEMSSYWGIDLSTNTTENAIIQSFTVSRPLSAAILGSCNDTLGTRPHELMISALIYSFIVTFTDRCSPVVFSEGHGRESWDENLDIAATVGWFTAIFPVHVKHSKDSTLIDIVRRTKDSIRNLPKKGWSHFTSRFGHDLTGYLSAKDFPVEILLNYQGSYQQFERTDSLFEETEIPDGIDPASGLHFRRFSLFEVEMRTKNGQIEAAVAFHKGIQQQQKISTWIKEYEATIIKIGQTFHKMSLDWTLADFPLAFQSYDQIDRFRNHWLVNHDIRPESIEAIFPCSPMQEGLMIGQAKHHRSYRGWYEWIVNAHSGGEKLDVVKVEKAWKAVVHRHALLRALIVHDLPGSNRTMHVILKDPPIKIYWPETNQISNGKFLQERDHQTTLQDDLEYRMTIQEFNERRVRLRFETNHTILDGYSLTMLERDFLEAYHHDLPPGGHYSEFIEYLDKQSQDAGLDFWTQRLVATEPCFFPSIQAKPMEYASEKKLFVPVINANQIHSSCAKWDITVATVIQTAWAIVLGIYADSNTPCFGTMCSGRDVEVPNINEILGPVIGIVPCKISLDQSKSVLETLRQFQDDYLNSLPHQHVPLAAIHRAIGLGSSSLFNSLVSFQKGTENGKKYASGLTTEPGDAFDPTEYDVNLGIIDSPDKIEVELSFRPGFISSEDAVTLANCISAVISDISTNPLMLIGDLKLLGHDELSRVWQWNSTVPATITRCVHEMIDEIIQQQPDYPAVQGWDGNLTYRELDRLSSQLASLLADKGVGFDMFVPLCFEKSMWVPVAVLAVLKAGGAFVLLDCNLPKQRLESIVSHLNTDFILSSQANLELSSQLATSVLEVSSRSMVCDVSTMSFEPVTNPSAAMFAVFTSGSTGTPKAVVLTHTNFASCLQHQIELLGYDRDSRVFDFASYAFDIAIHNLLAAFTVGGCLCIPSEKDRKDDITNALTTLKATAWVTTPSVARLVDPEMVSDLRTLILGGEPLSVDDVTRWSGKARVLNAYGPAECNVFSTINADTANCKEVVHIGRGVGLATWVVNRQNHNQILPPGCVGELLLEGPLVARGYLNQPEKTASAFISDPSWLLKGGPNFPGRHGRLYKTGDLVRYNRDGTLSFLGRKDGQVKIRGQRVELGEVETHVQELLPQGTQVVAEVIIPQGENARPTLVAFIKFADDTDNTAESTMEAKFLLESAEIQEALAQRLPTYMVPAAFFTVLVIPQTFTGKINRLVLRQIGSAFSIQRLVEMQTAGKPKRQPTSKLELDMRVLWARILRLEESMVGLDDSFFQLGGDSIAAMEVVAEAREAGIEFSIADLFRYPKLCDASSHARFTTDDSPVVIKPFSLLGSIGNIDTIIQEISDQYQIEVPSIGDAYPCTPLQEGLLSLTLKQSGQYTNQLILKLDPNVSVDSFCNAWEIFHQRTAILRTRIVQHSNAGLLQIVLHENIRWAHATDLDAYIKADRSQPMALGQPLSRFALIRNQESTDTWFVWTIHHAAYDGWTLRHTIESIKRLYDGKPVSPTPQYQQLIKYIQDQDETLTSGYWQNALVGCESVPFPAVTQSQGQNVAHSCIRHEIRQVDYKRSGTTFSTLVTAAWALVTAEVTNSDDIVFGSILSGRNAPVIGISRMAGPAVTTVPIRIKIDRQSKVSDYLHMIQNQAIKMIPFEQTGLHRIAKSFD